MKTFISERFWSDPLVEELGPDEKLAILWLLTNSNCDLCGFTQITHRRFTFETGLNPKALQRAMEGLGKGFVSPSKGFIWSRNFIAHQFGRGPKLQRNNITRSVLKHLESLPDFAQALVFEEYPELEEMRVQTEALGKPLPRGKVQVQVQERVQEKGTGKKKAKIPELDEVIKEILPRVKNDLRADWTDEAARKAIKLKYETFVEAGWRDGFGKPIKIWKTKFMNCLKNEEPRNFGPVKKPQAQRIL